MTFELNENEQPQSLEPDIEESQEGVISSSQVDRPTAGTVEDEPK